MSRRIPGGVIVLVLVITLGGLGLLAGGIFEIVVLETGTPAKAHIIECHEVGGRYRIASCTGTWVVGGSLVGGDGHVVIGTVDGASRADIGRTIDVRLAGDRAYTTSLRVPVILLVLGLGGVGVAARLLWSAIRRPAPLPPS